MSSDTFQVQRFGEEKQDDLENEQNLLAKLKAKIEMLQIQLNFNQRPNFHFCSVNHPAENQAMESGYVQMVTKQPARVCPALFRVP